MSDYGESRNATRLQLLSMPLFLAAAWFMSESAMLSSKAEGRCHFLLRFALFGMLEGVLRTPCLQLLMPLSRALARRLPGAVVPDDETKVIEQEQAQHDSTLMWPLAETLDRVPADWRAMVASSKKKQPFFLNHVRGCVRLRQAAVRVASAVATLMQVIIMSWLVDHRELGAVGTMLAPADVAIGVAVGAGIVVALFIAEVASGWLVVVSWSGEVVVAGESLWLNLLWDVLFHVGVAINEEVSLRGWVLVNTAHACVAHLGVGASTAIGLAVAMQASLFALYHAGSPGATRVGLLNLLVGGCCAALNVVLSGGLSFALGWHFGWNIMMGHLLGLSTSGIPMSAKLISVVPHPRKAHLHGGRFGPEQSTLAVAAYLCGVVLLVAIYGSDGLEVWRKRLGCVVDEL